MHSQYHNGCCYFNIFHVFICQNIPAEVKNFQKWASGSEALQDALRMEKKVTNDILCLHSDASIDADVSSLIINVMSSHKKPLTAQFTVISSIL